jgi:hypothetical protein
MHKLTCATCAYFDRAKPDGGDPRPDKGDCTRFPPHPSPILGQHPITRAPSLQIIISVYPSLPTTFKACGEYREYHETDPNVRPSDFVMLKEGH